MIAREVTTFEVSRSEVSMTRRAIVTAWALHQGYTVEHVTWEGGEGELAEGWVWTHPDGMSVGDRMEGLASDFPRLPASLFRELDAECPWRAA